MSIEQELYSFRSYGWHKGFYCDKNLANSLFSIRYSDFCDENNDDDFPYDSAHQLLYGACHIFALSLHKLLNYNIYIIEEKNGKGFHAFCQVYKNWEWYYIDARGVTTSFDEFMKVAKEFVKDEYIIRPVSDDDISEWKTANAYDNEAFAFAEAIIKKFEIYYTL